MRVFITGVDGYLGWPLALHLAARGHTIGGADRFLRRRWVAEVGSGSVAPIRSMEQRLAAFERRYGETLRFYEGDLTDYQFVEATLRELQPDAIVHLGEMPSAAYSMIDVRHAVFTQTNNLVATLNILFAMRNVCPGAPLVKMGTMGEYGTPNLDIPEGFFEIEYRGRKDTLPFPRQAGSWYHWSKVHDSNNVMFACRTWGLAATDVMQGVVFGTRTEETAADADLVTRLDIDQCFGTVVNRFCAQAVVGHPLTPFGAGHQRRGLIALGDSIQCMTLTIENAPLPGQYRVFNQFENVYDVEQIALKVQQVGRELGMQVSIRKVENPRLEKETHYYQPDHRRLVELGYVPRHALDAELRIMLTDMIDWRDRIEPLKDLFIPDIRWDGSRKEARYLC